MISLIFCTTNFPLSRLIRWIFREDVSHFALLMDNKVVIHSALMGMELAWFPKFNVSHQVLTRIDLPLSLEQQEELYQRITEKFKLGGQYDYKAFFYFGIHGILHRLLGWPLPAKNRWGSRNAWLCTEVAECLKGFVNVPENLDVISAGMLRKAVLNGTVPSN